MLTLVAGSSLLALAQPAFAQASDEAVGGKDEIVVTGTLVRGLAPPGTNVVGVTAADIKASSATTVSELVTDVPQFGSFNDFQTISGGGNFITTNRPNLRNLPGFTTTGTSSTLMMVDGNRVVGMGISSTTPDADFIAPGIIERVDIVPDGGSALYGSDAVAGVLNFVTMKRFDGVKVDARYGFGENYHTFDANATIGKSWDTGSIWVSYNHVRNDAIFGRDRSYNFTPFSVVDGLQVRDLECAAPNLRVAASPGGATALYGSLSAAARGTVNVCDQVGDASMFPKQTRQSVYAGLNQQLSDAIELDLRAFYYQKDSEFSLGQYSGSVNLGPSFLAAFGFVSSPFNVNLTGSPFETKAVNFALGPNYSSVQDLTLNAWGFRPTVTADLGGGWRLRTTLGYSESETESRTGRLASAATVAAEVASGRFNPFAPLTASAAEVATLTNFETYGMAKQRQFNARAIVDGELFELPGGRLKVAAGIEYLSEGYQARKGDTVPANYLQIRRSDQSRNVKSVFGEIVAPIFGGGDGPSLVVSAAGRYDDYSDVGGTFNPKFGATFKPVDWVSLRGAWGKSFVAPSMADSSVADPTVVNWIEGATLNFIAPPAVLAANGFPAVGGTQKIIFLLGANPGLKPQTAKTWSLGFDVQPPFIPGLRLSGTYYNLEYKNIIQLVPFINQQQFFSLYAPLAFTLNTAANPITQAQLDALIGSAGSIVGNSCAPTPTCVYGIQDVRKRNLGGFKQDGIDFSVDYRTDTGFGGVDFSIGGTKVLSRKNQSATGQPFVDETQYSEFKLRSSVGADVGNFRAQAVWNHNAGYDLVVPVGVVGQTSVGSFNTFDLFLKYAFPADGPLGEMDLTVNVNNVFNKYPPVYYGGDIVRNQRGFRNGNTLGRLVQVGLSKKF
jgi:iron complex outermembrane receptor protein